MQMLAYQRQKVRNGGQRGGIYHNSTGFSSVVLEGASRQPQLGIVGTRA